VTSFFFNITAQSYKRSVLSHDARGYLERVDISNGMVFIEGECRAKREEIHLHNLDRMVIMVMAKQGKVLLSDDISNATEIVKQGEIGLFVSSKQKMTLALPKQRNSEVFILFVADFFLKRYLSGEQREPIDYLYALLQQEISLAEVSLLPIDALSLYMITKLQEISEGSRMQSIRAEHRIVEFMMHRFAMLDIRGEEVSAEEQALVTKAKGILLRDFTHPPTIEVLAHLCATNTSRLKKVFKKVSQETIYAYIQRLRMEEASLLLKEKQYTIGEIAREVGYRHQGHFSRRFFETYGVYPRALKG